MGFVYKPVVTRKKGDRSTRRRSRYFWADYIDPASGENKRHVLKLPSGERIANREVAESELRRLLSNRERLAAGLTNQFIEAATTPVRKLLADWLRHLRRKRSKLGRGLSPKHLRESRRAGRWIQTLGAKTVADLQPSLIEKLIATLSDLGKSPKTITEYRSRINSLCLYAIREGRLEANPVAKTNSTGTNPTRERRALSPDEAAALLEKSGSRALWYETALLTGLRVGEMRALTWGDVDLDSLTPCIRLRAETTKAGRADVIPVKRTLADALRKARPEGWTAGGRVFATTPTLDTFTNDCRRAGFEPKPESKGAGLVDRHSLRKTFITWLSVAGVAPRTAQKLARHTDIKLTMRVYTDDRLLDGVSEVEKLPDLANRPTPEPMKLRATGTDDAAPVVPGVVLKAGEGVGNATQGTTAPNGENAVSSRIFTGNRELANSGKLETTGIEPATSALRTQRSPN